MAASNEPINTLANERFIALHINIVSKYQQLQLRIPPVSITLLSYKKPPHAAATPVNEFNKRDNNRHVGSANRHPQRKLHKKQSQQKDGIKNYPDPTVHAIYPWRPSDRRGTVKLKILARKFQGLFRCQPLNKSGRSNHDQQNDNIKKMCWPLNEKSLIFPLQLYPMRSYCRQKKQSR